MICLTVVSWCDKINFIHSNPNSSKFRKDTIMLLLTFPSQEERRKIGDSAFLEIQFCRMPKESPINAIVAVENIKNWQNDSLYVHEIADFISISTFPVHKTIQTE